MQTIYLDISSKGVIPRIYAKQNEIGRKFLAIITDSGIPYEIQSDSVVSVWYEGASGKGNYTEIGERSAISVTKNRITVELIAQMLAVPGNGVITVLINSANGDQIGLWNVDYCVESVAGIESEKAEEYYTAFSESTASLVQSAKIIKEKQEKIDSIIRTRNKSAAGLIYPLATENIPDGFLLCDGKEYLRTDYPELFAAIGTTYGSDGPTTFKVPDLATRVPVGAGGDYGLGITGGEATVKLEEAEMPEHRHELTVDGDEYYGKQTYFPAEGTESGVYLKYGNRGDSGGALLTTMAGSSKPHNNMQPYTVVNYIISTGKEIEFVGVGADGKDGKDGTQIIPIDGDALDLLVANAINGESDLVIGTLYLTKSDTNESGNAFVNAPAGTLFLVTGVDTVEEQVRLKGKDGKDYVLTDADKEEIAQSVPAVLYTKQDLTPEQKAQARENIGVTSTGGNSTPSIESIIGGALENLIFEKKLVPGTYYLLTNDYDSQFFVHSPAGTLFLATAVDALDRRAVISLPEDTLHSVKGEALDSKIIDGTLVTGAYYLATTDYDGVVTVKTGTLYQAISNSTLDEGTQLGGGSADLGDIETALDSIIAIQNSLIGGDGV